MKLKSNFQRNLIIDLFVILNSLIMGVIFMIGRLYFKLPIWGIFIFGCLFLLYYYLEPFDITKKVFKKYCNKECEGCSMWHCDFHYKDGKYVK